MRFQLVLTGLLVFPFAQTALAEPTRDAVMAGAARCAGIADNRTWLDCFYGSAQPMRVLLGLASAPPAQVKLVPPPGALSVASGFCAPVSKAETSRGFFAELLGSSKPVARDVPMASYQFARNKTFTVVLKNGERYRQEESDLVFAKWNRAPATYLVTVISASDDFLLRVKDDPGVTFHVQRM